MKKLKHKKRRYLIYPFLAILFYLLLYFFPNPFIPDLVNLSKNNNTSTYLATIISGMASISGLLIAIVLIAFEFYKSNLKKIYLKYFIGNQYLILLVTSFITVFIYSAISLLIISDTSPSNNSELTISYLSIISFILLIPSTFFYSYKLVQSLDINTVIDDYLKMLSFDDIYLLDQNSNIYFKEKGDKKIEIDYVKLVDEDKLEILQTLLIHQLNNDNRIKAQVILNKIARKFENFILSKKEEKLQYNYISHQYRYANFLTTTLSEVYDNSKLNKLTLQNVLHNVVQFYKAYNTKKLPLAYLEPFGEKLFDNLFNLYEGDEVEIEKILESVKKIIFGYIKFNQPSEKVILDLDPDYVSENGALPESVSDLDENNNYRYSWDKFNERYPNYFYLQLNKTIRLKNESFFYSILSIYHKIIFNTRWDNNLENKYLKSRWIIRHFMYLIGTYQTAIERDLIFKINSYDVLPDYYLIKLFKKEERCSRKILNEYLRLIIWLNRNGKLKYDVLNGIYSLGEFGKFYGSGSLTKLSIFLIKEYHNKEYYKQGFNDILAVIEIIYDDKKNGTASKDVTYTSLNQVLNEIHESYLVSRKKQNKSQKLLRKLNNLKRNIEVEINSQK